MQDIFQRSKDKPENDDIFQRAKQGESDIFKRSKEQPQQPPPIDETTWTEALGGLRPDRLGISFAKGTWQTVKGVPGLLSIGIEIAKEIARHGTPRSYATPAMTQKAKEMGYSLSEQPDLTAEEFPILYMIATDYKDRFGSMEGFKKTLADDPFSILSEMLPILAKAGKAGKLGKYSKAIGRTSEVVDPTNVPGEVLGAAGRTAQAGLAPYKKQYNPDVTSTYGRDAQGNPVTTTKSAEELATEYGAGVEDTPGMVLSDAKNVQIREGIQLHSESDIAEPVAKRFDETRDRLSDSGQKIVGETSPDTFNPEVAGQKAIENFASWQDGKRTDFAQKFGDLNDLTYQLDSGDTLIAGATGAKSMDTQVNPISVQTVKIDPIRDKIDIDITDSHTQYFDNTLSAIFDLSKSDSKLLPSSEYNKVQGILEGVIKKAEQDGFTLRDIDRLRTNFRTELDLAVGKNEITPIGAGTVSSKLYSALTKDFYNALEKTVSDFPDRFDPNFVDSVKVAKAEYAQTQRLLETPAAKFLFRNQYNPVQIVENVLTTMTSKDLGDLKVLLGDTGFNELKPALLSRMIDKGLTNGRWTPGGT